MTGADVSLGMRRLLFFLLFIAAMSFGTLLNHAGRYRDAFRSVCDLTETNFYKADAKLDAWVKRCRVNAARISQWSGERHVLRAIQDQMNELAVSHFNVYDPGEDKKLWTGEAIDTGIRSRYVEEALVIYKVLPGSAADDVDVRVGDEILAMQGTDQVTPWGASNRAGLFRLRRKGRVFDVDIEPRTLQVDMKATVRALDKRTALLEIPSFRADFFENEDWTKLIAEFSRFPNVIVDIRENSGGNFVAMLRALSAFMCDGYYAGRVIQPRKKLPDLPAIKNDMRDASQIEELDKYRSIGLRTYSGYGCYRGRVTVLISSESASVSEIFAYNFFHRPNSRVWGQPTAGDVILAVWYDLEKMGKGYSVSIPEAVYQTPEKKELENFGVSPQKELYYDLKQSLNGVDGWIEAARR
jgi:carboxyl-terminal processing protease